MAIAQPAVLADVWSIRSHSRAGVFARQIVLVLGGAAFVGLAAQVAIPLPFTPVPLTLQTFAVLLAGATLGSLRGVILVIIAMVTLKNVFLWAGGQLGASLQEYITRDLRAAVFSHMQRLPLGWFSRTKTGQIIARILTDTEQTKAILAEVATKTIQNSAQLIVTVLILYTMSPRLTLYALVVAPLIIGVLQPLLRKLRKGHRRLRAEPSSQVRADLALNTGVRYQGL